MKQLIILFGFLVIISCKNRSTNVEVSKSVETEKPHVFINDSINGVKLGASLQECGKALGIWKEENDGYYSKENMYFAGIRWHISTLSFYDGKLEKVQFISRSYKKPDKLDDYLLECNIRNMKQLKDELDNKYSTIKKCDYDGFETDTIAPSNTYFYNNCITFMFMSSSSLNRSCIYEYDDGKNLVSLSYHQYGILTLAYVNKELFDKHLAKWTPRGHSEDL